MKSMSHVVVCIPPPFAQRCIEKIVYLITVRRLLCGSIVSSGQKQCHLWSQAIFCHLGMSPWDELVLSYGQAPLLTT